MAKPKSTRSLRSRTSVSRKSDTKLKPSTQLSDDQSEPIYYNTDKPDLASDWTSSSIVGFFLLFFSLIVSYYLYSRMNFKLGKLKTTSDTLSQFNLDDIDAPICVTQASGYCLSSPERLKPSLVVLKYILKEIEAEILNYHCGQSYSKNAFLRSTLDLRKALQKKSNQIDEDLRLIISESEQASEDNMLFNRYFQDALSIIVKNPQFKLSLTVENEITFIKVDKDYPLSLPFKCKTKLMLWEFGKAFIMLLITFSLIIGAYKYFNYKKSLRNEEQQLIAELIEKSIDLIQSPDEPQSMPVVHIRDTLLTPLQRKDNRWKKIWSTVVNYIEKHECRVKVQVEEIHGEDFKTWKWCGDSKGCGTRDEENCLNTQNVMKTGTIEWQGLAFGDEADNKSPVSESSFSSSVKLPRSSCNGASSASAPFRAPTRFLKVRNMFNDETQRSDPINWEKNIKNAILEKCAQSSNGSHGILHLQIEDRNSSEGFVYIKCDTIESATVAFNALHGWWCERKLVSVRFLKEDRYYHRFPEAAHMNSPLTLPSLPIMTHLTSKY